MEPSDVARFASQSVSRLPTFAVVGPHLHAGAVAAAVGDSVHAVKPYFGLGVNSAFEDVAVLGRCLDECDTVGDALKMYTERHAENVQALVRMSRQMDGGFASFVLPIILDSVFK